MRKTVSIIAISLGLLAGACSSASAKYPTTDALGLSRVVLYRNGIGYFERQGHVDGELLRLKVRKDQINDLLKTLTVVKREGGQAVSISMPLDPQTWANAALSTLAPGRGSLAEVLDALRGTQVVLTTAAGSVRGRIAMVEEVEASDPGPGPGHADRPMLDHKITLLNGSDLQIVMLSKVKSITLQDGDLAMQFNRTLDASAGEGMFQQVEVAIRLANADAHDLMVSYVVPAPMWKPTYRVVLPESGKGQALLQAWAVVDNTSGEDWGDVQLALTSGAPIAFRYDLHTPRDVDRPDLTETSVRRRAAVAMGETTYEQPPAEPPAPSAMPRSEAEERADDGLDEDVSTGAAYKSGPGAGGGRATAAAEDKREARAKDRKPSASRAPHGAPAATATAPMAPPPPPATVDFESLRRSTLAQARATAVSGLTRFDIGNRVTVPDGTSTMVAIINQPVDGEETFMYRPGGAGIGYESNPYRVIRFRNTTPFVLESGPISIYAGGSFVGEGISETVGANTSATIPFAVETGMMVTSTVRNDGDEMHILRIVRGVLEAESFARTTTEWTVKAQTKRDGFTMLIRHSKAGYSYQLAQRPPGTEDLPDAYLIPIVVPQGRAEASLTVVEQTPSRVSISIWEPRATGLLEKLMLATNLGADARQKLEPVVRLRQEIGRIDTQIEGLQQQRESLDQRASETRENLNALKKDPAAAALRKRLSDRLEQFTKDGDRIGRDIVDLQSKRMEKKIELEDLLQNLDLRAPAAVPPGGTIATPPPAAQPAAPPVR